MRGNLWDDPRVAKLCDLTESGEAQIVGALYWLWATADQHTEDGILPGLTLRQIDRKTGVEGFAQALCAIGWLADHPDGVRLVRFEEHNGQSAKRRGVDAQRKASGRSVSAAEADKVRTEGGQKTAIPGAREREEKRREREEKIGAKAPKQGFAPPEWVPAEQWGTFVQMRKAMRNVPFTDAAAKGVVTELEKLCSAGGDPAELLQAAVTNGWRTVYPPKTNGHTGNRQEALERRNRAVGEAWAAKEFV